MGAVGAMLDYSVNACGEDLSSFYSCFISSGIASLIFRCSPRYIAGSSGIELALCVAGRTGKTLPKAKDFIDIGSPEYWTGWTLAYLSWYMNMDFRTMAEMGVSAESVYKRYPALHEADLTKSVSFARKQIEAFWRKNNPLKRARQNAGLTQKELAEASGINLRTIRAYEQGQLSLANAEYESVCTLSRILGCEL